MNDPVRRVVAAALLCLAAAAPGAQQRAPSRPGDYIIAVVNRELVTAGEVEQRVARARMEAGRSGLTLPPDEALRRTIVDGLIEERVLVTYARDSGMRIDESELDRAVANVAAQNQLTMEQLRDRLRRTGTDFARFRGNVRDQLLIERIREREVQSRIRISDADIDAYLTRLREEAAPARLNIAQILVAVPENARPAEVASRRARIESAQARLAAGESFEKLARELSEDGNAERGGEIGMRSIDRLPDLFVDAVKSLKPGDVISAPLRSGAGFHLLKLLERAQGDPATVRQTRARHILLRPSAQLTEQAAAARLAQFKRQIESGSRSFDALARENSEDGSAQSGGDLGWTAPGSFVPEFEEAMNALPVGGISQPVASRFGLHLIQVVDRRETKLDAKQLREQARSALREQRFEEAYNDWVRELRARAYIEWREPPS